MQGYTKKGKFAYNNQSEISLSNKQYDILVDLVKLLDNFSNLDEAFLEEGCTLARDIISSPEAFSLLMKKAHDASPSANKIEKAITAQRILNIIDSIPGITAREIQALLEERGQKVATYVITSILKKIPEKIIVTKEGNVNHYVIRSEERQLDTEDESKVSSTNITDPITVFSREAERPIFDPDL